MLVIPVLTFILLHIAIALAVAFWVLITAVKQEGWLKTLGLIFGWFLVALSTILIISSIYSAVWFASHKESMSACPMQRFGYKNRTQGEMMEREDDENMPMMNQKPNK